MRMVKTFFSELIWIALCMAMALAAVHTAVSSAAEPNRQTPSHALTSVVRIYCGNGKKINTIGSGVVVRWHRGKIYVLTARHVVADAKDILVEPATKKRYRAKAVAVDRYWDCAVLDIGGVPAGIVPADMEFGDKAVLAAGDRVESCGYGSDGKLAVHAGLFIGYRRSSENPRTPPDDWFEFSGRARPGDSGGPVFSASGRVVGILWGTDGRIVVGVQAGRLHKAMNAAKPIDRKNFRLTGCDCGRQPTPPDSELIPIEPSPQTDGAGRCESGRCPLPGPEPDEPCVSPAREKKKEKEPKLPWRAGEEEYQKAQDARIAQLIELERLRAANAAAQKPSADVKADIKGQPKEESKKSDANPLVTALVLVTSIVAGFVIYFAVPKA
jgi:hypothetical protein